MAIYKRIGEDGRTTHWQVVIELRDGGGKRRRRVVGTYKTKRAAEAAEREAASSRDSGTLIAPTKTTVGEVLERWLEVELPRTVRPENRQPYEIVVRKHLTPALGDRLVQQLTVEEVERFYAAMQANGYSASTIKKCHMRLASALRMAKRWKLVRENVCDEVKPPRTSYRTPEIWTPADVDAFLDKAVRDSMHPYWMLAVESGARTSELLGLSWGDLDGERGTLTIGSRVVRLLKGTPLVKEDAKTVAGRRTIRLTAGLLDELRRHQTRWKARKLAASEWSNPQDLVFCTASGRPINPAHVRRSFNRLVKQAGVTPITPHGIRKSHITHTIANGGNVKAVAARVGHRDVTTTLQTYTRLVPQMEDELMRIVERMNPRRSSDSAVG